jgi:hypothetical protein
MRENQPTAEIGAIAPRSVKRTAIQRRQCKTGSVRSTHNGFKKETQSQ